MDGRMSMVGLMNGTMDEWIEWMDCLVDAWVD